MHIINDEGALGITARASLHGAASKFRHWPMELVFHSRQNGLPLCPSIVARNMVTLLTAYLYPTGGPEIWSWNEISTSLSTRIPIQTGEKGFRLDT
jgi:hypothetical protein